MNKDLDALFSPGAAVEMSEPGSCAGHRSVENENGSTPWDAPYSLPPRHWQSGISFWSSVSQVHMVSSLDKI